VRGKLLLAIFLVMCAAVWLDTPDGRYFFMQLEFVAERMLIALQVIWDEQ